MVPSQIKIENLAQIILGSKTKLSVIQDKSTNISDQSVKEVYDQICSNLEKSQAQNNVLDLEFCMDEATNSSNFDSEAIQPSSDLLDQI